MDHDIDTFCQDLEDRQRRLVLEAKRLTSENARLLAENRTLREELTLLRLHYDPDPGPDHSDSSDPLPGVLPSAAMSFFETLPNRLNFADFFTYAESERLEREQAKEFLLLFFREKMLEQRGRRIEKCRKPEQYRAAAT